MWYSHGEGEWRKVTLPYLNNGPYIFKMWYSHGEGERRKFTLPYLNDGILVKVSTDHSSMIVF